MSFAPDLVFYLASADPYREDQLGGLSLTIDSLDAATGWCLKPPWLNPCRVCVNAGKRLPHAAANEYRDHPLQPGQNARDARLCKNQGEALMITAKALDIHLEQLLPLWTACIPR